MANSGAWTTTAAAIVITAAASFGLYVYLAPEPLPPQVLYGNGHVEGTDVKISAEVSGRAIETHLVEGSRVAAGDLLVTLDDTDLKLSAARAQAVIEALQEERTRQEREGQVAAHHLKTARNDLARYRELQQRGTVTAQRLEKAQDAFREASGKISELEAAIGATGKRITAARRDLDILKNQIAKTRIIAPLDATILVKAVEPGEFVQPGQMVATLVDLSRLDLKVFIPEHDIAKVRLGAAARLRVDAYPDRMIDARVIKVDQAAQFTPRDIHMPSERVRLVFGVTLGVDNAGGILKPGMPADAWILWQPSAGWPRRLFAPE